MVAPRSIDGALVRRVIAPARGRRRRRVGDPLADPVDAPGLVCGAGLRDRLGGARHLQVIERQQRLDDDVGIRDPFQRPCASRRRARSLPPCTRTRWRESPAPARRDPCRPAARAPARRRGCPAPRASTAREAGRARCSTTARSASAVPARPIDPASARSAAARCRATSHSDATGVVTSCAALSCSMRGLVRSGGMPS